MYDIKFTRASPPLCFVVVLLYNYEPPSIWTEEMESPSMSTVPRSRQRRGKKRFFLRGLAFFHSMGTKKGIFTASEGPGTRVHDDLSLSIVQ